MFKNAIDTKSYNNAIAALKAANAARDAAAAEEARVNADVDSRSRGGVTSPADQLARVLAQIAHLEAEDTARRAECALSIAATRLGVTREEADALARDPETLLRDLSELGKTIALHENALAAARRAWAERLQAAHVALAKAEEEAPTTGVRPLPLPAMADELGRPLSVGAVLDALKATVESGPVPASNRERIYVLRVREKELRATIERHRREDEAREKERRQSAELERQRREAEARTA